MDAASSADFLFRGPGGEDKVCRGWWGDGARGDEEAAELISNLAVLPIAACVSVEGPFLETTAIR